jgi:hypothetical protein
MNETGYISYYHSLSWVSSQLSKVITGYANKFNQHLSGFREELSNATI